MPGPDAAPSRWQSAATLAAAALIGALVFERCLGLSVLDPRNLAWIFQWGIDPSANFMGWHMFRSEPWAWPPGVVRSYGHPVGSSVGLADALPVVALPLKLVGPLLPSAFQYLGLWYLSCFTLLAVFGALLMRTATTSGVLQLLGAGAVALSPMLVHRIGHASLSAHWLVVAALWLHVSCRRDGVSRSLLLGWMAIAGIASGTTPYIAMMVLALAVPTVIGRLRDGRWSGGRLAVALGAVTALGWWASGLFVIGDPADLRNTGFGVLSANLLAPFHPPAGSLLHGVLPVTVRMADQLDGYCYLGLGGFWLVTAAAFAWRPSLAWARSITDVTFMLTCVGLTLFAISSTVTLGPRVLFEYDPAWWGPLTTLRASGRFVWPLYYALVSGLLGVIVRRLPHTRAMAVLVVAIVLQTADLWGAMLNVRTRHTAPAVTPLAHPFWTRILPQYAHLVLNPSNMCSPETGFDYRYFALAAGTARVTINAGYAPRHDIAALAVYCRTLEDDTRQHRVRDDTVYVVADALVPLMRAGEIPVTCARVDGFAACVTSASHATWDPTVDLRHHPLPPDDELQRFRDRLEVEYRDRMRRPAHPFPGTSAQRTIALARYYTWRMNGCTDQEAVDRLADLDAVTSAVPLCRAHALDPLPLPPGDDGVGARGRLEEEWARRGVARTETAVDGVGEAIWLHAYLDLRVQRRSPDEATADILATIRRLAP